MLQYEGFYKKKWDTKGGGWALGPQRRVTSDICHIIIESPSGLARRKRLGLLGRGFEGGFCKIVPNLWTKISFAYCRSFYLEIVPNLWTKISFAYCRSLYLEIVPRNCT